MQWASMSSYISSHVPASGMGKRSRDASFSPQGDDSASNNAGSTSEPDELRVNKLIAYEDPKLSGLQPLMHCSLPPHSGSVDFASVQDFETHYAKEHTNRCADCGKNMPSARFLNLHLDENHNPLREARAAKGEKTYACFLPDCEKQSSSQQKRRLHMIDKHHFPKMYNFRIVNTGIDNTTTLLQEGRRRRVSLTNGPTPLHRQQRRSASKLVSASDQDTSPGDDSTIPIDPLPTQAEVPEATSTATPTPDNMPSSTGNDVDDLEHSFAALRFVPRSIMSKRERG